LRKFFREIVEVTILHGVGSGMLRSDLCYFVTASTRMNLSSPSSFPAAVFSDNKEFF